MRCVAAAAVGHITAHCSQETRRALCAGEHRTEQHKCPVEEPIAGKGQTCTHAMAKYASCRGQHVAQVNVCPKKKEARRPPKGGGRCSHRHAMGRAKQRPPCQGLQPPSLLRLSFGVLRLPSGGFPG